MGYEAPRRGGSAMLFGLPMKHVSLVMVGLLRLKNERKDADMLAAVDDTELCPDSGT